MKLRNFKRIALIFTISLLGLAISIILNLYIFKIYYSRIDKLFVSSKEIHSNIISMRYLYAYIIWMIFSGSIINIILTPFINRKIIVPLINIYTVLQIFYFFNLYSSDHETFGLVLCGSFPTILSIYLNYYIAYSEIKLTGAKTPK